MNNEAITHFIFFKINSIMNLKKIMIINYTLSSRVKKFKKETSRKLRQQVIFPFLMFGILINILMIM